MVKKPLTANDYPIAETQPDEVIGNRGKPLSSLTMGAVLNGDVSMEDLRITSQALEKQAEIATSVGRFALASNLKRASEMTRLPQSEVMAIYELLRPGRATSVRDLLDAANRVRNDYDAQLLGDFLDEAASFYNQRGLFRRRY